MMSISKKISALLVMLLLGIAVNALSQRNYIRTDVMLDSAGSSMMSTVRYYDGLGRLEQTVAVGASPSGVDLVMHHSRDYCGNYVYCNGRLERVLTHGGYISGDEQHFYITDYQGNVRVVQDRAGRPVEVNSYYPYGTLTGMGQSVQPYKYGAKELDRENGLNLYDSHARHYDPLLGRTTTLDPKATEYYSISPYAWCAGNPVKFVDPDGRKIVLPQGFSIENIYKVLNTLQLLTNDKLVYTIQNDGLIRIKIASLGVGKAQAGTTLIRRLNSSRKTLLIDLNNSQGYFSKDNGNRAKALDYSNATNGIGSDAIVSFDPYSDPKILTQISKDGQVSGEKRPPQIGLGHELIHAEHYMDGDLIPNNKKVSHSYINKDGKRITQVKKAEEFRTIGIFGNKKDDITENDIRKEQNLKPRGAY